MTEKMRPLRAAGAGLLGLAALLLPEVRSQLDFGESLESSKCSFGNFQDRVNEVEAACCAAGKWTTSCYSSAGRSAFFPHSVHAGAARLDAHCCGPLPAPARTPALSLNEA